MNNTKLKIALSFICLLAFSISALAAPVRINQVVQTINAKPGKAKTGGFAQLNLADDETVKTDDDTNAPQQDGKRVIVTKTTEITEAEECDCIPAPPPAGKFPKWALLGLAAIPVAIILLNRDKSPTPTPSPSGSTTPTPTGTPGTPTPTPTPTLTPTPPTTPTPEPVPEPMTILLFGTGLAGIGLAARKRLRRKSDKENV